MQIKRIVGGLLSVSVLAFSFGTGFTGQVVVNEGRENLLPIEITANVQQEFHPGAFTGKVVKIVDHHGVPDANMVRVEGDDGNITNFIVSKETYIVNEEIINEGSIITGLYNINLPVIMIYPPQYGADMIIVHDEQTNIKVDTFSKDLISSDNSLKLNISDETKVLSQDGKNFNDDLANRKLFVMYDVSTRSIPAQTNPSKVVVLTPYKENPLKDVSEMDIFVENKLISAPRAYENHEGKVMVPLRAIAETLGFEVGWNKDSKTVTLGTDISLRIQSGAIAEMVEDRTFVPLNFFREVVGLNNAYVVEGQIVIDDGEKLE